LDRLGKIRKDLESYQLTRQTRTEKEYGELLSDIYDAANLEQGSTFIENRVSDHVNSALVRYLSDPANSKDSAPILAQTLAAQRMTDILTKTNPLGERSKILEDIENSTTITLPAFSTFVETFQKEIRDALGFLQGQEVVWGKDGTAFQKKRARICLMLSGLPAWPGDIPYASCVGTSYGILNDGPVSPVLTADYISKPVDQRSCGYFNLERATLIHSAKMDFDVR
jgi:hypothetical protein